VGDADTPIVGLATLASLVTLTPDGGTQAFGLIGDGGATNNSLTLGITTDTAGNVYIGVAAVPVDAGNVPPPGVYRFPPDGGAGTLFSSSPQMNFANGFDFIGAQLYVADSYGYVFSIAPDGGAAVWSSDPLLAPDAAGCDAAVPLGVGANGIVNDSNNVYVTNTNFGRLIQIPIESDGGAGTPTAIVNSCSLVGADGLVIDTTNNTFLIALNIQNAIARVALDGGTSIIASGGLLNTPASVVIDTSTGTRRLLFTNATFFSGSDPGVLTIPLP